MKRCKVIENLRHSKRKDFWIFFQSENMFQMISSLVSSLISFHFSFANIRNKY